MAQIAEMFSFVTPSPPLYILTVVIIFIPSLFYVRREEIIPSTDSQSINNETSYEPGFSEYKRRY
jgi:hypothetical protein